MLPEPLEPKHADVELRAAIECELRHDLADHAAEFETVAGEARCQHDLTEVRIGAQTRFPLRDHEEAAAKLHGLLNDLDRDEAPRLILT